MNFRRLELRHREQGVTVVEFAVVAATLLLTLFTVIDLSRIVYLRMTFEEGVRRGARLAAVCPIGDPLPPSATLFVTDASGSPALAGATFDNVVIEYLAANGDLIGNPANSFSSIAFVRVSLQGIEIPLLVPFISEIFAPENISSTAVAESLGVAPAGVTPC